MLSLLLKEVRIKLNSDSKGLYQAFLSKDIRFDGRFFVGISSTGIYCRPVCRAKTPKFENCTYYSSAAEAESAGYRPCLLCRPELAPGISSMDSTKSLVYQAARLLEEECGDGHSIETLATKLGCTSRHLRRAFKDEFHVSPVQYLQTCRLLLAKSLLTDTDLSILDVAIASGFGSLRRFNDVFKKEYKLVPTELRKTASDHANRFDEITVSLGYRSPYQWDKLLNFLEQRAVPGVELVKSGAYFRTVSIKDKKNQCFNGWICVRNNSAKNVLSVTLSSSLLPVLPQILAKVRHLFDLYCEPATIETVLKTMNTIQPSLFTPGLRVPGCFDSYELAVRAVLGQQITIKAARTLASRFAAEYGQSLQTGIDGLTHTFPTPEVIIKLDGEISNHLGPLGITSARSKTILSLAHSLTEGELNLSMETQPEDELIRLLKVPGIGPWTANYIAMRAMGWPDAFLETDYGIKKALKPYDKNEIVQLAEQWRPWRSYATMNLWNSL